MDSSTKDPRWTAEGSGQRAKHFGTACHERRENNYVGFRVGALLVTPAFAEGEAEKRPSPKVTGESTDQHPGGLTSASADAGIQVFAQRASAF